MSTTISAGVLRSIQRDVLSALAQVEKDYGVKFKTGRSTYSNAATGAITLDFATVNEDGQMELDRLTKQMIATHGLTDLEVRWTRYPGAWRITGYNSRAPKYAFTISERGSGKTYRIPLSMAQSLFGLNNYIPFDPPKDPSVTKPQETVTTSSKPQREYASSF